MMSITRRTACAACSFAVVCAAAAALGRVPAAGRAVPAHGHGAHRGRSAADEVLFRIMLPPRSGATILFHRFLPERSRPDLFTVSAPATLKLPDGARLTIAHGTLKVMHDNTPRTAGLREVMVLR